MVTESYLEEGALRMLEVDKKVILLELTHVRFIISSGDVIHSYACPSLVIKKKLFLIIYNNIHIDDSVYIRIQFCFFHYICKNYEY